MLAATYLHLGHLEKAVKWAEEAQSTLPQRLIERGDIMLANAQERTLSEWNPKLGQVFTQKAFGTAWQSLETNEGQGEEDLAARTIACPISCKDGEAQLGPGECSEKPVPTRIRALLGEVREPGPRHGPALGRPVRNSGGVLRGVTRVP